MPNVRRQKPTGSLIELWLRARFLLWTKDFPTLAALTYRLSEERLTPKARAASLLPMPRSNTARTMFSVRSCEYAFIRP